MSRTATRSLTLCTFRAASVPDGFDIERDFVVCPWGTIQTRRGPVTVNEQTLAQFDARQKAERRDKVAGDFAHNTLAGVEPVKVAGYWKPRVEKGRGIVVALSSLTPEAQLVKDGHYADLSPAIERDEHGVVIGLHSFAFVRHGEMAHAALEIFSVDPPAFEAGHAPQPKTNAKPTMNDTEMLAALLAELGVEVAPDASPEAKIAALEKAKAALKKTAPSPEGMSAEVKTTLTALSARMDALTSRLDSDKAKQGEKDVDALISAATGAGKEIKMPRASLVAMGAERTQEYLATLPAGVVTPGTTTGNNGNVTEAGKNGGAGAGKKTVLEAYGAEGCAMMRRNGIDPEEVLKNEPSAEPMEAGK